MDLNFPEQWVAKAYPNTNIFRVGDNDTYFTRAGKRLLNVSVGPIARYYPEEFKDIHLAVAGGSFRSLFFNETPTDLDVFLLTDMETGTRFLRKLRQNLMNQFPDAPFQQVAEVTITINKNYTPSEEAITKKFVRFNIPVIEGLTPVPIQMIHFCHVVEGDEVFPTSARELINLFDVVPACFAAETTAFPLSFHGVSTHAMLLDSLLSKTLIPNMVRGRYIEPVMTLDRFYKYTKTYGFSVSKSDMPHFTKLMSIPNNMNISYDVDDTEGDPCSEAEVGF